MPSVAVVRPHVGEVVGTLPANDGEDAMHSPLAYSIAEACAAARAGRTAIYEAIKAGELIARKRGRRTIILSEDLRRWLDDLPALTTKPVR
jgi:excisionase family DNA binding protein